MDPFSWKYSEHLRACRLFENQSKAFLLTSFSCYFCYGGAFGLGVTFIQFALNINKRDLCSLLPGTVFQCLVRLDMKRIFPSKNAR